MFSQYTKTAIVSRMSYTTDWAGNKKSWYAPTGNSYLWKLKSRSVEKTIDINMFWKVFLFTTDINADILEGDRVSIDGTTYDVQWVQEYTGKIINTKKLLIKKQ